MLFLYQIQIFMATSTHYSIETSTYWNLIKNVSDEVKIRLITLLSESLLTEAVDKSKVHGSDKTDKFLKKFYGSWRDGDSTEDIINKINDRKSSKEPISFD